MNAFEDCKVPVGNLINILEEQAKEAIEKTINNEDVNGDARKLLKEIEKAEHIIIEQALKTDSKSLRGQLYLGIGYFRCKILELEYEMKEKENIKNSIIEQIETVEIDEDMDKMFNRYKLITEIYRLYEDNKDSSLQEFKRVLKLTLNHYFCDIEDGELIGPDKDILPF